jgi:hypothetical protein
MSILLDIDQSLDGRLALRSPPDGRRKTARPETGPTVVETMILCAREIPQAMEPAQIAETAIASLGDATVLGRRSVKFSTCGRSMTFWPMRGRQR